MDSDEVKAVASITSRASLQPAKSISTTAQRYIHTCTVHDCTQMYVRERLTFDTTPRADDLFPDLFQRPTTNDQRPTTQFEYIDTLPV